MYIEKDVLKVGGMTEDGRPYDIFKSVKINGIRGASMNVEQQQNFDLRMVWQGHY